MKAESIIDVVTVLVTKAQALEAALVSAGNTGHINDHTDHSWYSVPEAVIDDLKQATDLVIISHNKINTIISPGTLL